MPERGPEQDVTALLHQWQQGDASALERLLPIVYDELLAPETYECIGQMIGRDVSNTYLRMN